MSSSKYIDKICVAIVVLALVFTALFMSGKLPIEAMAGSNDADDYFSYYDLNESYDESACTKIKLNDDKTEICGNGAYVNDGNVYITLGGNYVLSGTLSDGSVIVNAPSNAKVRLLLNGVDINASDTAALYVEQADKTIVTLADNSENTITCGSAFDENEKTDGAVYSKDDLSFNGSGTLNVNAEYKHGIVCNDDLVMVNLTLNVTAPQDTIHANDSVRLKDVDFNLSAGDDGITVSNDDESDYLYIASGNIVIDECYEGLEATDIIVDGGTITIYPEDDGLNSMSLMTVNDGSITVLNTKGNDADGFDSNGSIVINGGEIYISLQNSASNSVFDYGSENGGELIINGGTIVAAGGAGMAESVSENSAQASIMFYPQNNVESGSVFTLSDSNGNAILSQKIEQSFSELTVSSPQLTVSETYTISVNDSSEEITLDCVNYSDSYASEFSSGGGMPVQGNMAANDSGSFDSASSQGSPPEKPSDDGNAGQGGNMQSPPDMNNGASSQSDSNAESSDNFDNSDSSDLPQAPPEQNGQNGQGAPSLDGNSQNENNAPQIGEKADDGTKTDDDESTMTYLSMDSKTLVSLGVSVLLLALALLFAIFFKSRRV